MTPHQASPSPQPSPQSSREPILTLRARTPDDLVAFVPVALGFVPQRSVVLVSIGGPGMHARVDLPHDVDDVDDVVEALLRATRRNHVTDAVVVVYDDDTTVADETAWAVHEELTAAGTTVHEVVRVHDSHWYAVLPGAPLAAYRGVPFTLTDHRFTAEGVLAGRVTHASRDELRATLACDPAGARATAALIPSARPLAPGGLAALVRRHLADGTPFTTAELACVARTVSVGERRDEAWARLTREQARSAVDLWSDAVRRLPAPHLAGPAAVLAFAAWLLGDGALAWCAVDRSREDRPDHSLASLVADLLEGAVPPSSWELLRPGLVGSDDPAA